MFKVLHSGKRKKKQWKRMVTKVTFVGPSFTRKPPKYERFIRPSGAPLVLQHSVCATDCRAPSALYPCTGEGTHHISDDLFFGSLQACE